MREQSFTGPRQVAQAGRSPLSDTTSCAAARCRRLAPNSIDFSILRVIITGMSLIPDNATSEQVAPRIAGRFAPGLSGNPAGRPVGTVGGRQRALAALDDLLNEAECQAHMQNALRAYLMEEPLKFFKTIVMPLLPQEQRIKVAGAEGVVQWTSLLTAFPREDAPPSGD
jgi:hypothetical protein